MHVEFLGISNSEQATRISSLEEKIGWRFWAFFTKKEKKSLRG
jgi:hypothetical protein